LSGGFMTGDQSRDPELAEQRRLNAICNGAAP
jgi:hypothetical protein